MPWNTTARERERSSILPSRRSKKSHLKNVSFSSQRLLWRQSQRQSEPCSSCIEVTISPESVQLFPKLVFAALLNEQFHSPQIARAIASYIASRRRRTHTHVHMQLTTKLTNATAQEDIRTALISIDCYTFKAINVNAKQFGVQRLRKLQ